MPLPKPFVKPVSAFPVTWNGTHFELWAGFDDINQIEFADSSGMQRLAKRLAATPGRMVRIYGSWRKTTYAQVNARGGVNSERKAGWAIDIFARIETIEKTHMFSIDTLCFTAGDPRTDLPALNTAIAEAVSKWFFKIGAPNQLIKLVEKAEHAQLKVPNLQWLDNLLLQIKEVRETAFRSGGERHIVFEAPNGPKVTLTLNFTSLAIALDGKPPAMNTGGRLSTIKVSKKAPRSSEVSTPVHVANPDNVRDLLAQVAAANERFRAGDQSAKKEARDLRALLRKLGHKGGARNAGAVS